MIYEINDTLPLRRGPSVERQASEPARKAVKHTVPGTISRQMQAQIVSELRGGRSAVQVGKAYQTAVDVVLELFVRDLGREIAAMRERKAA